MLKNWEKCFINPERHTFVETEMFTFYGRNN